MPMKNKNAALNKIKMETRLPPSPPPHKKGEKSNELELRMKPERALQQGLYTMVKCIQVRKS